MISTMLKHQFDRPPPPQILHAWQDWLTAHGIDPFAVPIDSVIERRVGERQIAYEAFVCGSNGDLVRDGDQFAREVRCVQLDAAPAPFPADG